METTKSARGYIEDVTGDEIPAGTFCGPDNIPQGTFHGPDNIPPGTFH